MVCSEERTGPCAARASSLLVDGSGRALGPSAVTGARSTPFGGVTRTTWGNRCGPEPGMVPYRDRSREGAGRCGFSVLGGCVATRPVPLRETGGQAIAPRQEETGNRCGPEPGMVPLP
jgi:hypothetical protein